MLSIEKINELEKENQTYKRRIVEMNDEIKYLKTKLDEFADKFNDIWDLTNFLEVRSEDENGYMYGEEEAIWGDGLDELRKLTNDFIDFAEEIK